jgi:hypothetical protein
MRKMKRDAADLDKMHFVSPHDDSELVVRFGKMIFCGVLLT